MSRSALSREEIKYSQPPPPPPPPQPPIAMYQYPMAPMGMMPGMMYPNPYEYVQQPYVPIPLTGDEDDIEDPEHKTNTIAMHGNLSTFNINTLLHQNITESDYFKALYQLRTYHEVVQEINASVKHVEPWQTGTARIPSTAFCLLLKLMLMKLTYKQMTGLLEMRENPLLRAFGFLYLRYTCYNDLWKWYEKYLEDDQEICPSSDTTVRMTIGQYCIKLLTDMSYFSTTLPRIPVPIERKIKVMLLLLQQKQARRKSNHRLVERGGVFVVGAKVRAIYGDETNEPAWYEAVIDSIDEDDANKYWVTFPEYGNSECVDLGDMEQVEGASSGSGEGSRSKRDGGRSSSRERGRYDDNRDRDRRDRDRDRDRNRDRGDRGDRGDKSRASGRDSRDRDRNYKTRSRSKSPPHGNRSGDSRSRSRDRDNKAAGASANLWEAVLQSSRDASAAVGKNYGQRPASYKGSLALKVDRFTVRKKSKSRSPDRGSRSYRDSDRDRDRERDRDRDRDRGGRSREATDSNNNTGSGGSAMAKTLSAGQMREQQERMRRLKDQYGDASAK